jgi:hypothetical protein
LSQDGCATIRDLKPIVCAVLAAKKIDDPGIGAIEFEKDEDKARADYIGLTAFLAQQAQSAECTPSNSLVASSKLTKLTNAAEVNKSNSIVVDLLAQHLGDRNGAAINAVASVVGELHDNVTSHAHGAGFSTVQLFTQSETTWITFAVADAGRGMLRNVRRCEPTITTDHEAIEWCLKKGNTTGKTSRSPWEQRLPEDFVVNPYPPDVVTATDDGLHAGLGLWTLGQFVARTGGRFWIGTGTSECVRYGKGSIIKKQSNVRWPGVAIELAVNVTHLCQATPEPSDKRKRWGL